MNTYTNPQMLSPEELHKAHLEMATKYLESKWDGYYYEVNPYTGKPSDEDDEIVNEYEGFEDFDAVEEITPSCSPEEGIEKTVTDTNDYYQQGSYYIKLTNEQFYNIQKRIKESGERVLSKALSGDPELMQLLQFEYTTENAEYQEQYFDYATNIGDIPHVVCNIRVCTIEPTGSTQVFPYDILLTKEDYLKLLVIVMDHRWVTFNELFDFDFELYRKISEIVNADARANSERNKKQSYTLVFDDIEKDVYQLLGEEGDSVTLYGDTTDFIMVDFREKKMAVFFKKNLDVIILDPNLAKNWAPSQLLYNIDAKSVMNALHVDSYHEATNIMAERFSGRDAFDIIKEFLEKEKIAYKFTKIR